MTQDETAMQVAFDIAYQGVTKGQAPFGAAIYRGDELLVAAHNTNAADNDCTCHAEMNAIRQACQTLGQRDLSGLTIYATCEPCPMCFTACHWANLDRLVYSATVEDADQAGFRQLFINARTMKAQGQTAKIQIIGPIRQPDGIQLLNAN